LKTLELSALIGCRIEWPGEPSQLPPPAYCTVTVNVPVAALPAESVAVQETVVVPSGNVAPLAGAHASRGLGSR
jgi:hypothetical protein